MRLPIPSNQYLVKDEFIWCKGVRLVHWKLGKGIAEWRLSNICIYNSLIYHINIRNTVREFLVSWYCIFIRILQLYILTTLFILVYIFLNHFIKSPHYSSGIFSSQNIHMLLEIAAFWRSIKLLCIWKLQKIVYLHLCFCYNLFETNSLEYHIKWSRKTFLHRDYIGRELNIIDFDANFIKCKQIVKTHFTVENNHEHWSVLFY